MARGSRIAHVYTAVGTFNKYISIASYAENSNRFAVFLRKTIIARIFNNGYGWFLWNERFGYRINVKNVTEALSIIEKECAECGL